MIKNIKKLLPVFFILVFCILLIMFKEISVKGVVSGLYLCLYTMIPSMFPFLSAVCFLIKSGGGDMLSRPVSFFTTRVMNLPPLAGGPILLSFIGGYPASASAVINIKSRGIITDEEAGRMMMFCPNAGPAFIISAVGGGMMGNVLAGLVIFISCILSSFIIGYTLGRISKNTKKTPRPIPQQTENTPIKKQNIPEAFCEAVSEASASMMAICAMVVLFSAVYQIIMEIPGEGFILAGAALEVSRGCFEVSRMFGIPLTAAVIGFGGLSVHFQLISIAKGTIKYGRLFAARCVNAVLSFLLALPLMRIIPGAAEAFVDGSRAVPGMSGDGLLTPLALITVCMAGILVIDGKWRRRV